MNLVLPEGARKLGGGGGEEEMQSKGHICTCPVLLHCFGDICQQVFGLFFTYDATHNLLAVYACNHERKHVAGGGGAAIATRGVPWGSGGGRGSWPPPPRLCLIRGCMVPT